MKQKNKNSRSMLFDLYLARVAAVDLVHTMRSDKRKIFAEAFAEAKVALAVYSENMKNEGVENE